MRLRRPLEGRPTLPGSRGRARAPREAALALLAVARSGAGAVGRPRRALAWSAGRPWPSSVVSSAPRASASARLTAARAMSATSCSPGAPPRPPGSGQVAGHERLAQRRLEQAQAALTEVRDGRQVGDLDGRTNDALDVAQVAVLAWLHEGDRDALATGPAGAPGPVHVDLGRRRHVVVDDVAHVLDVEAAGRDVGRDEHVQRALAEAAHDPVALLLRQAAVERCGVAAATRERLREVVHLAPGPGEDERGRRVLQVEDPAERRELVGTAYDVGDVANARGLALGAPVALHADADRVAQVGLGEARDRAGDRRAEQCCLALQRERQTAVSATTPGPIARLAEAPPAATRSASVYRATGAPRVRPRAFATSPTSYAVPDSRRPRPDPRP